MTQTTLSYKCETGEGHLISLFLWPCRGKEGQTALCRSDCWEACCPTVLTSRQKKVTWIKTGSSYSFYTIAGHDSLSSNYHLYVPGIPWVKRLPVPFYLSIRWRKAQSTYIDDQNLVIFSIRYFTQRPS